MPRRFQDADRLVDAVIAEVGREIVLALPLGLGKANHFANALYRRARADASLRLTIHTALSLDPPAGRRSARRSGSIPMCRGSITSPTGAVARCRAMSG